MYVSLGPGGKYSYNLSIAYDQIKASCTNRECPNSIRDCVVGLHIDILRHWKKMHLKQGCAVFPVLYLSI